MISHKQTVLDQYSDACARSPPWAKNSLAEEGYREKILLSQLCPVPTPPYLESVHTTHSNIMSLLSTIAVFLTTEEQWRGFIICAFRSIYKRKLTCAKMSHQLQDHPAEVQGCQVAIRSAAKHPPLPTSTTSHLVTESTEAFIVFWVLYHVQLPKTTTVPPLVFCYTHRMLH